MAVIMEVGEKNVIKLLLFCFVYSNSIQILNSELVFLIVIVAEMVVVVVAFGFLFEFLVVIRFVLK